MVNYVSSPFLPNSGCVNTTTFGGGGGGGELIRNSMRNLSLQLLSKFYAQKEFDSISIFQWILPLVAIHTYNTYTHSKF